MLIYFPSCNFTKASPEAAKRIRSYLAERMPVAGCCRFDTKEYGGEDEAVYFCQACRETLEGRIRTQSLWEYLDQDEGFLWPDYQGAEMSLQDCWRDRGKPEIHQAVRSVLRKMNIRIIELEENQDKSVFCGNLHFEPGKEDSLRLMGRYKDKPIYEMPQEVQAALMREQAEKFAGSQVVCYCNRCVRGIRDGGGRAVHLLELAMGTAEGGVRARLPESNLGMRSS